MSALAVAGGAQALASGYQIYEGIRQKRKGNKLEDSLTRPVYEIPEEIGQNVKLAQGLANEGIQAAEENAYLDNLASAEASTINNFRSRKGQMVGAEVAGRNRREGNRALLVADAKARLDNQMRLMQQRGIMANYKDTQFQINQLDPYTDDMNNARALQGAGMQNINNAVQNLASSATSFASYYAQNESGMGQKTK